MCTQKDTHPPTYESLIHCHGGARSKWFFCVYPSSVWKTTIECDTQERGGEKERKLKQKVWSEWIELRWNYFLSLGLNFLAYVFACVCVCEAVRWSLKREVRDELTLPRSTCFQMILHTHKPKNVAFQICSTLEYRHHRRRRRRYQAHNFVDYICSRT